MDSPCFHAFNKGLRELPSFPSKIVWPSQAPGYPSCVSPAELASFLLSHVLLFHSFTIVHSSNTGEVSLGTDSTLWVFLPPLDNNSGLCCGPHWFPSYPWPLGKQVLAAPVPHFTAQSRHFGLFCLCSPEVRSEGDRYFSLLHVKKLTADQISTLINLVQSCRHTEVF